MKTNILHILVTVLNRSARCWQGYDMNNQLMVGNFNGLKLLVQATNKIN